MRSTRDRNPDALTLGASRQASGELVERATFYGYGGTESDYRPGRWEGFRSDYRFTGKEEDIEVGLVYFGKRYLNPQLGRWISADPLGVHAPGEADWNLYAYVSGAVLRAIDPVGLQEANAEQSAAEKKQEEQFFGAYTPGNRMRWAGRGPKRAAGKPAERGGSDTGGSSDGGVEGFDPVEDIAAKQGRGLGSPDGTIEDTGQKIGSGCTFDCSGEGNRKDNTLLDEAMLADAFAQGNEPGKEGVSGGMVGGYGKPENASPAAQAVVLGGDAAAAVVTGGQAGKAANAAKKGMSKWERILTNAGRPKPSGMTRPHGHHIVFKGGWFRSKKMREVLNESRDILKRAGIDDYVHDARNLTWAENRGHSIENATKVLNRLRDAEARGSAAVLDELQSIGEDLTAGVF